MKSRKRLTPETKERIIRLLQTGLGPSKVHQVVPQVSISSIWGLSSMIKKSKQTTKVDNTVVEQKQPVARPKVNTITYTINGVEVSLSANPTSVTIIDNTVSFQF